MEFSEILNNYIDLLDCSSKDLSKISNISESVISRYRNGDRIPKYDSKQLESLIIGLSELANKKNIDINEKDIRNKFDKIYNHMDIEIFRNNLSLLINSLKINVADLSRYMGFDSSYISKIKNGERSPKNINDFCIGISKYVFENYKKEEDIKKISSLLGYKVNDNYYDDLINWIYNNKEKNELESFLIKLDNFDLNEYIKIIKFDKLKVPTLPIKLPKSKTYYGLEGFKKSQLDILKGIVLSKSKEDIFFYSNMPMIEASKDLEFTKKFMFGVALILKKGHRFNIIHNLNRPFKEIMIGLEGWLPLYMTGLISPYYFKENEESIYSTIDCFGAGYAMNGRCINGNINKSKFYLTNKKEEIEYYKENSKYLLKKASSLMDIYDYTKKDIFNKFINNLNDNIRNINYNIPIYTISLSLLNKILDQNNINEEEREKIIQYVKDEKKRIKKILENNSIIDEINILPKEDFKCTLSLSKIFYNNRIIYTYEDYLEHIKLTKSFKQKNKNYNYKFIDNIFKNINISIVSNQYVIISKENNPSIHFVINHPLLIEAMNNFKVQIKENK